jgi:hypothetical protein
MPAQKVQAVSSWAEYERIQQEGIVVEMWVGDSVESKLCALA